MALIGRSKAGVSVCSDDGASRDIECYIIGGVRISVSLTINKDKLHSI